MWETIQTMPTSSCGMDGVNVTMLRCLPKDMVEVVVHSFNSMWAGEQPLPKDWFKYRFCLFAKQTR
eukprot:12337019-Prorocentrum_lima.AAC.1